MTDAMNTTHRAFVRITRTTPEALDALVARLHALGYAIEQSEGKKDTELSLTAPYAASRVEGLQEALKELEGVSFYRGWIPELAGPAGLLHEDRTSAAAEDLDAVDAGAEEPPPEEAAADRAAG